MRNSDYIELYKNVRKLESDMDGNESIESWKRSIEKIKMDLWEVSDALKIVNPKLYIKSIDGTISFSIPSKGDDLISETISVISAMVRFIERIIELNCSEDIAPSFMDYEYGDLYSLITSLKSQIHEKLDTLLNADTLILGITQDGEYVYTTYKNPSLFYDVDSKMYVGRLVEVNGVYKAILKEDKSILKFDGII